MLAKTQLHDLYYWLLLNRTLEDRIASLRRAGKIPGAICTSRGQEAVSVGTAFALEKGDIVAPLLRNNGSLLVRGFTPEEILSHYMGKSSGPTAGRDCAHFMGDLKRGVIAPMAALGSLVPVIAGVALAARMKRLRTVALTYIGDGGSATSDFHEGLNLAAVQKVPMVLVLEENGWAFSVPTSAHAASTDFLARARAYGVAGYEVDGNKVIDVYEVTKKAVEEAREGRGPALIVAHTMRTGGEPGPDDAWFVSSEVIERWKSRDPIHTCEKYLCEGGFASSAELRRIAQQVRSEVDDATAKAIGNPLPEGHQMLSGVYHEA